MEVGNKKNGTINLVVYVFVYGSGMYLFDVAIYACTKYNELSSWSYLGSVS